MTGRLRLRVFRLDRQLCGAEIRTADVSSGPRVTVRRHASNLPLGGPGGGSPPASREERLRNWYYVLPLSGDFIVEQSFGAVDGIAGGNFLILAQNQSAGLMAAAVRGLLVSGDLACGYPRPEKGGHRLVGLSPVDAAHRGHPQAMAGVDQVGRRHGIKAPTHDGVFDPAALDAIVRGRRGRRPLGSGHGCGAGRPSGAGGRHAGAEGAAGRG